MTPPREGDRWFMEAIEEVGGFSSVERKMINDMRNHQQVVYKSDIFMSDGAHLDGKYRNPCQSTSKWSTLWFSKQRPLPKHISLWQEALDELAL